MKKVIFNLFCLFAFMSCTSNLTESKIRTLLKENLTSEDLNSSVALQIGHVSSVSAPELENYRKLEEEGLLRIEKDNPRGYNIYLTDKADPFVVETIEKQMGIFGGTLIFDKMKAFTYEVDVIEDIHENPSENTATARVTFRKTNKTPFFILLKDKTEFMKMKVKFFKTTDGDWKLLKNE